MFFSHGVAGRHPLFLHVSAAMLALLSARVSDATDPHYCYDLQSLSSECGVGCGDAYDAGCADDMLTGPLYEPSEPPVDSTPQPFVESTPPATTSLFAEGVEGTLTAQGHAPGYIDWALPRTQLRMRFDSGWDSNRPDRAEFFYAQYQNPGPGDLGNGRGNTRVDFHELSFLLEVARGNRFSVFAEVPVRFLEPSASAASGLTPTGDEEGFGDLITGFKYALSTDPSHFITFQFKTYYPTGSARRGLGTEHVSLEPGLLVQSRVNSRLTVFGEVRDWIPIDGSDNGGEEFAGNVLRYGVGAAWSAVDNCHVQVSPIVEFVGWSVLDGQVFDLERDFNVPQDANTTIVNAKVGVRTLFRKNNSSLYVGYGNALTGQRWYEDFLRLEYTIFL